jgi:hypothetical protein
LQPHGQGRGSVKDLSKKLIDRLLDPMLGSGPRCCGFT